MSISDLLRDAAAAVPAKPALIVAPAGTRVTFGTIHSEAERVAAGLQDLGIEPGDRVAIAMGNIPHFVYAYFGILKAGAIAVPLNVMLTAPEMKKILVDSGARVVLSAPPFSDVAEEAARDTKVARVLTIENWEELGALGRKPREHESSKDDIAVLAYTSGTTGEPKGAMLTHGNLRANLEQQMAIPDSKVGHDDVLFLALPLFHIFGLNVTLGLLVLNAATGVLIEKFEPVAALRAIQEHEVTFLFGAPTMYVAWVNTPGADQYDLSKVRLAVSGSAPLQPEILDSFRQIFGIDIFEGYGLTETAPTLTTNRVAESPRAGSVGKPLPGVELRLIDEEGNDVETGDPGEVVVRGPNIFKGYWNREEETKRAFIDGWFKTGDVAVKDEEGHIYLVDRKRDLIIVSGFNVFPSEVEHALEQNPNVKEAGVVGAPHPYTGEAVKAFVVLQDHVAATVEELIADVSTRLARFKCPESIEIVEEIPHLLTGKVLRRALRT